RRRPFRECEHGLRQGRPAVQAPEGRRLARSRHSLQVRHQGQQGRLARAAVDPSAPRACTRARDTMEQAPTEDRALSLDEAMSVAILLQQNEQWSGAAEIYRSILEVAPDHADALHYSGVLAHQQARGEEAIALI